MAATQCILLVDDDRELCAALTDLLVDCGYDVAVIHTGAELGTALRHHRPAAILLDDGLPDTTGQSILAACTEPLPPVLLMSGLPVRQPVQPPVRSVLMKPFRLTELLARLANVLEQTAK